MSQRRKVVVGNWKMHGSSVENAALLAALRHDVFRGGSSEAARCDVAVCVPYPYLAQARTTLTGSSLAIGAQNVSEFERGAYTGEVSAAMLADMGCRYVIVGHSERRSLFGETSESVAAKAERAMACGLVPIVCVGETLAEREAGEATRIVAAQLLAVMDRCGAASFSRALVAYEPVWAIGTGKTATPDEAQVMHAWIRAQVAKRDEEVAAILPILYGGSVKASNAGDLFGESDIDGGLIGGASLVAGEFSGIIAAACERCVPAMNRQAVERTGS